MKLIWIVLLVTIFVNGMQEKHETNYTSLEDVPSLAKNENLKEEKFEKEELSTNGIKENYELKEFDFSKANIFEGKSSEGLQMRGKSNEADIFSKTLDKGAISLTPNNDIMNFKESTPNLNFDDYMRPLQKTKCILCGGRIFNNQLYMYIGNPACKTHAICTAGYGGYEYSFSSLGTSKKKYNKFQQALLKIFKSKMWLNTFDHIDFIWNMMEIQGFKMHELHRTADYLTFHMRKMKRDIAYSLRKYKGEEVYFYIHRSNWPKPEIVNWKAYIVEILKAKGAVPLIDFVDWDWKEEMYVPWKLLYFIKEYTKYSSFEKAVRDIPNVEIFYCDNHSRKYMRLKYMPYSPISEPKLTQAQKDRNKEEIIKVLKGKGLSEAQINALLVMKSKIEIKDTSNNILNPIVEKAVDFVKRAQKCEAFLSEERIINFMKEKGLTKKDINYVLTETSQADVTVPMTAYSTARSQDIIEKHALNQDEIGFKYQNKYNTWTPQEEKRKNEVPHMEESFSETNSLFDYNSYQENSIINDLSYQNSPTKYSSTTKEYQI